MENISFNDIYDYLTTNDININCLFNKRRIYDYIFGNPKRFANIKDEVYTLEKNEPSDQQILYFIYDFISNRGTNDYADVLHQQFTFGYCWYFAHMIKLALSPQNIGVYLTYPMGHFVARDSNGVAYDVGGRVDRGDTVYYIPDFQLPRNMLNDFKHVPGLGTPRPTTEDIIEFGRKYAAQSNFEFDEQCIRRLL